MAIYEILLVDDDVKDLILKKTPSNVIKRAAVAKGMRILRQDGWQKVISGVSTTEEVMQVTPMMDDGLHESRQFGFTPGGDFEKEKPASETPPGLGRRVYSRINKKINLSYKLYKSREELLKGGFQPDQLSVSKNVSAGGLLIVSASTMPIGAILDLKIELVGENEPIECLAKIVRVEEIQEDKEYEIAICFLDITSAQRAKLNRYVETEVSD